MTGIELTPESHIAERLELALHFALQYPEEEVYDCYLMIGQLERDVHRMVVLSHWMGSPQTDELGAKLTYIRDRYGVDALIQVQELAMQSMPDYVGMPNLEESPDDGERHSGGGEELDRQDGVQPQRLHAGSRYEYQLF